MSNLFFKSIYCPGTYCMLAEFLPLYYPISEPIFTYIFPVSVLVKLETICSCSYFLLDYDNLICVSFVETLDPFKHF